MPEKEGKALSGHLTFYAAAPQCSDEIHQVLRHHLIGITFGRTICIISEQIAKLGEITANGIIAIIPE